MFDTVLENIEHMNDDIDAILIAGDFVVHGLSSKDHNQDNWSEMKKVIGKVMQMVKQRFPSAPILPNIGNNDLLHHY